MSVEYNNEIGGNIFKCSYFYFCTSFLSYFTAISTDRKLKGSAFLAGGGDLVRVAVGEAGRLGAHGNQPSGPGLRAFVWSRGDTGPGPSPGKPGQVPPRVSGVTPPPSL